MKKVLAMLLAAAMATTMAFAADITIGQVHDSGNTPMGENGLFPGESYELAFPVGSYAGTTQDVVEKVTVKWEDGVSLVESLKLKNKSGIAYLELNLKENYTIYEEKDLVGKVTVKLDQDIDPNAIPEEETFEIVLTVGNNYEIVTTEKRSDDADTIEAQNNTVYEADGTGYINVESGDGLLNALVRMKDGARAFLYMEEDADALDTVLDNYDEADDAYVHTYDYIANPSVANATLTLQADYKDQYYIYELNGTKLKEVKASWNKEDGQYEWDTNTLSTYVISEVELVAADEPADEENNTTDTTVEENPSTGANDFVGLAVALAVVSVAGIAVAKRK